MFQIRLGTLGTILIWNRNTCTLPYDNGGGRCPRPLDVVRKNQTDQYSYPQSHSPLSSDGSISRKRSNLFLSKLVDCSAPMNTDGVALAFSARRAFPRAFFFDGMVETDLKCCCYCLGPKPKWTRRDGLVAMDTCKLPQSGIDMS
jgi:hypothetical protein